MVRFNFGRYIALGQSGGRTIELPSFVRAGIEPIPRTIN
jgi:hypothetical protein